MALRREDLEKTQLCAGDTVEYYSQQYLMGDPRGLKTAIVMGVKCKDDYPLQLNSLEVVRKFSMIRRIKSPDHSRARTVWRKVRTFDLVNGTCDAPLPASELNARLRGVVADAMREVVGARRNDHATRDSTSLVGSTGGDTTVGAEQHVTSDTNDAEGSERVLSRSVASEELPPPNLAEGELDESFHREQVRRFQKVPTAAQIRKRHHQPNPKNTGGWTGGRSRKKKYRDMRGHRRDSKRMYNCNTTASVWLRKYIALPTFKRR